VRSWVSSRSWWVVLVGALLLVACGDDDGGGPTGGAASPGGSQESSPRAPGWAGELRMIAGESATMDPARMKTESAAEWDRATAIFDTLLRWKADGTYTGQLAESMESDDGVTWTLRLREGVHFTDGTVLDADAVLFNLERLRDPANAGGFAGTLADVVSMRALDPLTVEIVLGSPNGTFWQGFTSITGMIGSPTAIRADEEGFGSRPVGAGPYVLAEYQRDNYLLLERNPDYWDPTKPAYERIRIQFMVDPVAKSEALKAGEAQLTHAAGIAFLTQLGDPAQHGLRFDRYEAATFVLFNFSRGPAQDVRIREAISKAFDPSRVNTAVLGGLWETEELVCPPFDPSAPECRPGLWAGYDLERAKQLVAEYAAEGKPVTVTLLGNTAIQGELEFIQQTLEAIGLDVRINAIPAAEWLPKINAGEFDIAWYATSQPVTLRLYQFFRTDQRNIAKASIPGLDEVLHRAMTAIDADERVRAWHEAQEIMAEQYLAAWYAPFIDGYVMEEGIRPGDQLRTVHLHLSEVAPA